MMKKGILAILAMLTVSALLFVSCGGGGGGGSSSKGKQITITFDLNLPEGVEAEGLEAPAAQKIAKGGKVDLAAADLSDSDKLPAGYDFLGWGPAADSTEDDVLSGDEEYAANTTLYALWFDGVTNIKVYFNINYGSTAPKLTVQKRADKFKTTNAPSTTRTGYTFKGWYGNARGTGTPYVHDTTALPATGSLTVFADWDKVVDPDAPEIAEADEIKDDNAEYVIVDNRFYAIYEFKLPAGARWADYDSLEATYEIDSFYWDVPNSAAGSRLMGNFELTDFEPLTTTKGNLLAISNFNDRNTTHILDGSKAGSWKSVGDVAAAFGVTTKGDPFTVIYDILGSRKDGAFTAMPDPMDKGPFYFGLGIGSQGATPYGTPQKITNIKLVPNTVAAAAGITAAYATPLYLKFTEEGGTEQDYPAYAGYGNKNGSASEDLAYRSTTGAKDIPAPEAAAPQATADFEVEDAAGAKNSAAFEDAYGYSDDLIFKVEFPAGLNASSYAGYEILAKFYDADGEEIASADGLGQVLWTSDVTDWNNNRIGSVYNLNEATKGNPAATPPTVAAGMPAALKYYPSDFDGIVIQNSKDTVKFIEIISIKFFVSTAELTP